MKACMKIQSLCVCGGGGGANRSTMITHVHLWFSSVEHDGINLKMLSQPLFNMPLTFIT